MAQEYYQSAYTGAQFDSAVGRIVSGEFDELANDAVAAAQQAVSNAESAVESAAIAVSASEASQSAYNGVQNAIKNIPSGSTIVINDLTTGGVTAALSAEQGKILGRRSNQSIVDNGHFGDPVNQRGSSEYGGSTAYTIDRWRPSNANTLVIVGDGSVSIKASGAGVTPFLLQQIGVISDLRGKNVTLSVMMSDGSVRFATAKIPEVDPTAPATLYAMISGFACILCQVVNNVAKWYVRLQGPSGGSNTFKAVKLELGSNQTLANQDSTGKWVLNDPPPDKGLETLKCQRYYQLFSSADKVPAKLVDYRPVMRANPATGTIVINGETYYYADANL